jgi:hypothetical protein
MLDARPVFVLAQREVQAPVIGVLSTDGRTATPFVEVKRSLMAPNSIMWPGVAGRTATDTAGAPKRYLFGIDRSIDDTLFSLMLL